MSSKHLCRSLNYMNYTRFLSILRTWHKKAWSPSAAKTVWPLVPTHGHPQMDLAVPRRFHNKTDWPLRLVTRQSKQKYNIQNGKRMLYLPEHIWWTTPLEARGHGHIVVPCKTKNLDHEDQMFSHLISKAYLKGFLSYRCSKYEANIFLILFNFHIKTWHPIYFSFHKESFYRHYNILKNVQ